MIGWGEFELEVMRDRNDNVVIICSIENVDPMGVHTGDSVTVAPAQTLTDPLYQELRDVAIEVIRAIGVETGGSNVQFAVNPESGEIAVIEMNPRVSRSSALPRRRPASRSRRWRRNWPSATPSRRSPTTSPRRRRPPSSRRSTTSSPRSRASPSRSSPAPTAASPPTCRASARRWRSAAPSASPSPRRCARASSTPRPSSPESEEELLVALEKPCAERFDLILEAFRRGIDIEAVHAAAWSTAGSCASCEPLADRGRRHRGPGPHLQGGRHLRRRVRGGDALLLLGARAPPPRRRRPPPRSAAASATRSSSSAPARTGSARGSSSTTAASTRR